MYKNDQLLLELLVDQVLLMPAYRETHILKGDMPNPKSLGFRSDIGEPRGQTADFRRVVRDGHSIHIREYDDRWDIHWDKVDPLINGAEHLRRDSPGYYTLTCASVGSGLGASLGYLAKGKTGAAWGALIGLLMGALFGLLTAEWD